MDHMRAAKEGTKRRLPLWMSGDQGRSKSETVSLNITRDDDKGCQQYEEKVMRVGRRPKSQLQKKGNGDSKFKLKESSSKVPVKSRETNKTKREVAIQEADISEVGARKKRKCSQKPEAYFESETEKDVDGCQEDVETEDLTVEDLMSIAKEYIEEDNDAQVLVPPSQRDSAVIRSRDDAQSDSFLSATDTSRRLFESRETSSSSINQNIKGDTGVQVTISENSTQDMLDVFLGPWLKKTREQEKENKLIPEFTSCTHKLEQPQCSIDVGEKPTVVAKKKISLKDQVAMFLD